MKRSKGVTLFGCLFIIVGFYNFALGILNTFLYSFNTPIWFKYINIIEMKVFKLLSLVRPFPENASSIVDMAAVATIAIDAASTAFQLYHAGVFTKCAYRRLDHAVVAVGYGSEEMQGYWIVRNSWGLGWGEEGYIRSWRKKGNDASGCLGMLIAGPIYPRIT